MFVQKTFQIKTPGAGFHLITQQVMAHLPSLPKHGLMNLFLQHTSAALSINENADSAVRVDLKAIFDRLVKERESYYTHTLEGADDMPAHAKSTLVGASLNIPIMDNTLGLGMWQGIYLCEFRSQPHTRSLVITVFGE